MGARKRQYQRGESDHESYQDYQGISHGHTSGLDWNTEESKWKFPGIERRLRGAVELLVDAGVAHDGLDVFAGFGEWDRLDKLRRIAILALPHPFLDTV